MGEQVNKINAHQLQNIIVILYRKIFIKLTGKKFCIPSYFPEWNLRPALSCLQVCADNTEPKTNLAIFSVSRHWTYRKGST